MAYRGEDLDLRTPQDPALSGADVISSPRGRIHASTGQAPGRSAPIWVDDTLLDCCNHAFEVALHHRAAEVRLEHLIYAMTRIDAAMEALDQRGVRVIPLRRETLTIIATEIPVGAANGKGSPRRSDALEEVLRLASSAAYRRQSTTGIDDVLNVLLDYSLELPAMQRLRGFFGRPQNPLDGMPPEPPRERLRQSYYTPEPRPVSSELSNLASAQQAYSQSSRIDILEQSIRTLTHELSNERKVISGVLQDLQREIMAQRDETARLGGVSQDKIQGFLSDRLQGLEQTFFSARGSATADIAFVKDMVANLDRTLTTELAQARAAIAELAQKPGGTVDLTAVTNRLDIIEEAVLSRDLADRIQALEDALAAERERASGADSLQAASLDNLVSTVQRQPSEISNPLTDRMNGLAFALDNLQVASNSSTNALQTSLANADQRIGSVQSSLSDTQSSLLALAGKLDSHVAHMAKVDDLTAQEFGAVHEAFGKLTAGLTEEFSGVQASLNNLAAQQRSIGTAIETQSREAATAFAMLAKRIESLERATEKPVSMLESLSATTDKMHRLMVEKYFRRNRLWYWLFGTDDWLAASWPSQTARIAKQLDEIR